MKAFYLVLIIALTVFLTAILLSTRAPERIDFLAYWSAERALLDGKNPYDGNTLLAIQSELNPEIANPLYVWNPPVVLGMLYPILGHIRIADAWVVFSVVASLSFLSFPWLITRIVQVPLDLLSYLYVLATPFPLIAGLIAGQISVLLAVTLSLGLLLLHQRKDFLAGILFATQVAKPHVHLIFFVLIGLDLILARRWLFFVGALGTIILGTVCIQFIFPSAHSSWLQVVSNPFAHYCGSTLNCSLMSIFPSGVGRYASTIVGVICAVLCLFARTSSNPHTIRVLWAFLSISPLLSPYGFSFDQTLSALCAVVLFGSLYQKVSLSSFAILITLFLLALMIPFSPGVGQFFIAYPLWWFSYPMITALFILVAGRKNMLPHPRVLWS